MQSDQEESSQNQFERLNKLVPNQYSPKKHKNNKDTEPLHKPITLNLSKQKKPRLVIDHMILENFKSYAGKQKIGPFHANFTSVVGPNGSGKSNLIQSMLFIFGFNASWMRLNKLNQLIHNSSTLNGLPQAAVEVHFKKLQQLSDGSLVQVPHSHFMIRRTVNSASISKYYLMGRDSTQAQVKERLKSQGIDLANNRFLILQGQVEQISQMKQKSGDKQKPGLLQYLQDIIGCAQFVQKIQQCGKEYAVAEQQKHEKGQLMKLVQNELKGMSKAKDEALKFIRKQKRLFQLQNILNQVLIFNSNQQLKKIKQNLGELEKIKERVISEEKQKLKKQGDRIKQIKKNKAQIQHIQKKLESHQQNCNKMQIQDKNITQDVSFKSQDIVKFQRKVAQSQKQMSKIINQCEQIKNKMPKNKQILDQRGLLVDNMKKQLSKYQKPQLRQKIKNSQSQISNINLQSSIMKNKIENIRQKLKSSRQGKDGLQKKLSEFNQKNNENKNLKQKIEKAKTVVQQIIRQKTKTIKEITHHKQQSTNQLNKIQTQLKAQLNEKQQKGQFGNMFRQIMNQNIPGVLGRLGDLGQVSKEYDQIITTCCGRLDNIVCTNIETASAVLDILKKKRLGRATCIILDKISQHRNYMNKPFQNLPRSTRLFDVIKFKTQQAKLAFYFALQDTLYCQDSDLGLQYSMKNQQHRRRIISKNKVRGGYIIYEKNGIIAGSVPKRGGFDQKAGIKVKKNNKDEGYLIQMQTIKRHLLEKIQQLNQKIQRQQKQLKIAQQDYQQMKRQYTGVNDQLKQIQDQINQINTALSKSSLKSNKPDNIQIQLEALINQQIILKNKKQQFQKILKLFQDEQRANDTQQINKLRQKYKSQRNQLSTLQKQVEKQRAILQNAIKRIDDLKKLKNQSQKFSERAKHQIDNLKAKQIQLQKKVTQIIGQMTALQQRLQVCKKYQEQLKVFMADDQKQLKQSKMKIQKVKKDVQICQQNYKKYNQQLKIAESQLQKTRQDYKQLASTYTFMEQIDQIQKMQIVGEKHNIHDPPSPRNTSLLQTSMLNSSIDSNQSRIFPTQKINKIDVFQKLNQDMLQSFCIFKDKIVGMISNQNQMLKKMQGSNLQVINQFKIKYIQYKQRLGQFQAVKQRQAQLKKIIDNLKQQRLRLFRQGFGIINSKLKQVYQHLTRGGDAQLQIIDALDPFSQGINFSVRPPKKTWKQVNKLSGGQKTLSSLSLIFALHYYKPTPLYFMDQIDAALDFKNVSIVADYIKKRTKDAQFIIISLRNNMFDLADKLVGVYKTHDKTHVIGFEPGKLLQIRQNQQSHRQQQQARVNSIRSL